MVETTVRNVSLILLVRVTCMLTTFKTTYTALRLSAAAVGLKTSEALGVQEMNPGCRLIRISKFGHVSSYICCRMCSSGSRFNIGSRCASLLYSGGPC